MSVDEEPYACSTVTNSRSEITCIDCNCDDEIYGLSEFLPQANHNLEQKIPAFSKTFYSNSRYTVHCIYLVANSF